MIRLTLEEINTIKKCFSKFFHPPDKLWVFGSRVRPDAKGGDIDLYIETQQTDPSVVSEARLDFLTDLKYGLGDQKIDVVIQFRDFKLPIHSIAKKEGVQLL